LRAEKARGPEHPIGTAIADVAARTGVGGGPAQGCTAAGGSEGENESKAVMKTRERNRKSFRNSDNLAPGDFQLTRFKERGGEGSERTPTRRENVRRNRIEKDVTRNSAVLRMRRSRKERCTARQIPGSTKRLILETGRVLEELLISPRLKGFGRASRERKD